MAAVFQAYVRELKEQGKTVLLSSHILAEVEALCDRVTIIREGKTIETGALSDIQMLQRTNFIIESQQSADRLAELKGVHEFEHVDGKYSFEVEPAHLATVTKQVAKLEVSRITSHPPKLEELFLRYYDQAKGNQES